MLPCLYVEKELYAAVINPPVHTECISFSLNLHEFISYSVLDRI